VSESPNRMAGIILGVIYMAYGIFGFFMTSSTGFTSSQGQLFLGFLEVNPLQNLGHLVLGIALLVAGLAAAAGAKWVNTVVGAIFFLIGIVGIISNGDTNPLNILALNGGADIVHFATAVILLAVGIGADRSVHAPKTA